MTKRTKAGTATPSRVKKKLAVRKEVMKDLAPGHADKIRGGLTQGATCACYNARLSKTGACGSGYGGA